MKNPIAAWYDRIRPRPPEPPIDEHLANESAAWAAIMKSESSQAMQQIREIAYWNQQLKKVVNGGR